MPTAADTQTVAEAMGSPAGISGIIVGFLFLFACVAVAYYYNLPALIVSYFQSNVEVKREPFSPGAINSGIRCENETIDIVITDKGMEDISSARKAIE